MSIAWVLTDVYTDANMSGTDIGARIKALREERGWTLGRLAQRTGFETSYISMVENGKRTPKIDRQERFAHAFGLTVGELRGEQNHTSETPSVYDAGFAYLARQLAEAKGGSPDEWEALLKMFPSLSEAQRFHLLGVMDSMIDRQQDRGANNK
jgi:transcriptional regulator with XRE-family HTH domain